MTIYNTVYMLVADIDTGMSARFYISYYRKKIILIPIYILKRILFSKSIVDHCEL